MGGRDSESNFTVHLGSEIVPSNQFDDYGDGIQLVMVVEKIFLEAEQRSLPAPMPRHPG